MYTKRDWILRLGVPVFLVCLVFGGLGTFSTAVLLWGDRATAHVSECHEEWVTADNPRWNRSYQVCTGYWWKEDGEQATGEIIGADEKDVRRKLEVRLGPDGEAYAGSLSEDPIPLLALLLLVDVVLLVPLVRAWRRVWSEKTDPMDRSLPGSCTSESPRIQAANTNVRVLPMPQSEE